MTVSIERSGSVWTVIHDRPEATNAMDPESAQALVDAFTEFDADPEARVAVFWGAGGAFCAGWDLKYAASLTPERFQEEIVEDLDIPIGAATAPRGPLGPSRRELGKPVIGAIERIGLCERVVPHGAARAEAEAMAHEIARFPQQAVRADRRSIIETRGLPTREALRLEWANGLASCALEGVAGAARFRDGKGRSGDFADI